VLERPGVTLIPAPARLIPPVAEQVKEPQSVAGSDTPPSLDTDALVPAGVHVRVTPGVTVVEALAATDGQAVFAAYQPQRHPPPPNRKPPQWSTDAGRERYAFDYLRKNLDLNAVQTAALVGNLAYESYGFNLPGKPRLLPTIVEGGRRGSFKVDDGIGYGIAQWTLLERKEALQRFADNDPRGRPVSDFGLQLDYVVHEIKTADKLFYSDIDDKEVFLLPPNFLERFKRFKTEADLEAATNFVENEYESPKAGSSDDRFRLARQFLHGRFGVP
jgi:hypothetical protein